MALEQELATYQKTLDDWTEHEGRYVLINGDQVIGFFSSHDDAIREGYERFNLTPFLVKRVSALEQVHLVSRFFDPCLNLPAIFESFTSYLITKIRNTNSSSHRLYRMKN